jgi:membrane-bound lytic murein transglycosylase A
VRAAPILALALLALASCGPRLPTPSSPPRLTLSPASFADLAGWDGDATAEALPAFLKSCAALARLDPGKALGPDAVAGTAGGWRGACEAAQGLGPVSDAAARRFFETHFVPWRVGNNGTATGLFTGYFEPELLGARQRGGVFQTPILKRPADLVSVDLGLFRPDWRGERTAGRVVAGALRPYATRAEIEAGALDQQHLAFLWVDDPIAAFILSIQGSGRIRLPDGSLVRVGYDGQNGWPYVAIGKLLVERGVMGVDDISLQSIEAWLRSHPDDAPALMDENRSYVFFRELQGDGPIGAEGVVLTAGRSLAVDPSFLPQGVPLWVDAAQGATVLKRLMVAQDTGGAIRGPVRGDVFFGFGAAAEASAGGMRATGGYYLLLPSDIHPPRPFFTASR